MADFAQVPRVKAKFTEAQPEGGKYTEAMAEVYLPPSESTLLRSPPSPHPPTVGLMISTPTA